MEAIYKTIYFRRETTQARSLPAKPNSSKPQNIPPLTQIQYP